MSRQVKPYVSQEEYLAMERMAEYKNEYVNGEVFAMTGASRKHNLIAGNIVAQLNAQLKGKPCEVYPGEVRVKAPASRSYVYPDVVVVCGEPKLEDAYLDTLLNPTLVVEVLSKSTESYNRLAKAGYYRTIESLAEYMLVAQDEYRIEQYVKQADGRWLLADIRGLESIIDLQSIDCSLVLRDVYDKVSLAQDSE